MRRFLLAHRYCTAFMISVVCNVPVLVGIYFLSRWLTDDSPTRSLWTATGMYIIGVVWGIFTAEQSLSPAIPPEKYRGPPSYDLTPPE